MIRLTNPLAAIFLAISLILPFSAVAEVIENVWEEIDQIIPNDPDQPCGDATFFRLEGMVHRKVSTLQNGNLAININVMGDFTPLDGPNAGEAAIFRQNISDVFPIFEPPFKGVRTIAQTTKVISQGQADNYLLNLKFHVTYIDGEYKSYFDTEKVRCQ